MLVGSTPTAIEGIHTALERKRAADSRAVSAARNRPSTREIHSIGSKDASSFTFHGLKALSQFPDRDRATALLARLRDDHAIKHILTQNRWAVGSLIEIHPLEQSSILGYNQNKGQVIALRLRTDALDGFRNYDSIRKVLLHELAHMVHSEHDDKFHKLNRELNTECDSVTKGARKVGSTSTYNSGLEDHVDVPPAFEGGTFKLGGGSNGSDAQGEVARREVLARAAMGRLTKEEIALVHSCGNASSASHSHEQSNGPS
ncbi:WLM domain-containing protein [Phlyctochytrium arcticum]|nr:WLM domain-containing protein [Phlyctochytrium arcticum]